MIEGMVKVDPAHRLTSKEVQSHPWIKVSFMKSKKNRFKVNKIAIGLILNRFFPTRIHLKVMIVSKGKLHVNNEILSTVKHFKKSNAIISSLYI